MAALLEAKNVTKVFGGGFLSAGVTTALENLSLAIEDEHPSVTVLAGESGSGKTTLARLLLGIIKPTSGQIRYKGKDLAEMSKDERKTFRREVQAIFQDPFEVYNPFYKVDRVLTAPLKMFGLVDSKAAGQKLIGEALEMVGLHPNDTLGRYPHQLSGGQRQRIMVARALILKPRIIVADEPVSMVDASLRATILESLLNLTKDLGISLVYITHDLTTAYQVGDNILILYQGTVAELGDVDLVIKQPQHPYTQLLVDSIPLANPNHKWGANQELIIVDEDVEVSKTGCKFANRCPAAMPICSQQVPPVYRVNPNRGATCFLYKDSPVLAAEEIPAMLLQISQNNRSNNK